MIAKMLISLAFLTGSATGPKDAAPSARAFENFKNLVGQWQGTNQKGQKVEASYELVAAGSAVLERYIEPNDKTRSPMITLYHLDGDRLMLTHYCMAGNQPRMRAESFGESGDEVRFELVDATNLATPDAGHMHRALFEFKAKDRLVTRWTWHEKGKDVFTETQELKRVESTSAK